MQFESQLVALPAPNRKHFVLKHVIFPCIVKTDFVKSLCYGECHGVMWHGNAKNTKKALYDMMEKMGGFQVQMYSLQPAGGNSAEGKVNFYTGLNDDDIDAGFDYIEKHGPGTHHSNTQLRWISKQFISEDNPVGKWPERLIKEALRNLMNDGVLALPVHDFPLTLVDVEPGVLMILEKLFPSFTDKALGMHGFRETSEFDFFRGEAGRPERPDIFDDGSLPELLNFTSFGAGATFFNKCAATTPEDLERFWGLRTIETNNLWKPFFLARRDLRLKCRDP
ncbi:unnamed protein product [Cladocopium goreaui]|uniref:ATPase AAA-type core domain-containing protein n=1 Tax=Cladocopium goreaui TaxID=2562237 RepID=A0A9P1DPD7_9DINO|nr:unnamed protein product [Cladocopium goreaui]